MHMHIYPVYSEFNFNPLDLRSYTNNFDDHNKDPALTPTPSPIPAPAPAPIKVTQDMQALIPAITTCVSAFRNSKQSAPQDLYSTYANFFDRSTLPSDVQSQYKSRQDPTNIYTSNILVPFSYRIPIGVSTSNSLGTSKQDVIRSYWCSFYHLIAIDGTILDLTLRHHGDLKNFQM